MRGGKALSHNTEIHRQQGDIDGACAVYSVMMCLLILGYVKKDDLDVYNPADRRTFKGKLLFELLENRGLVRNGTGFVQLKRDIKRLSNGEISVTRKAPRSQDDIVQTIADVLDDDIAPVISVFWKIEGAHALLAIGYEADDEGVISKILCLDPAADTPQVSAWNCYLEVKNSKGEYPIRYVAINREVSYCELGDLLILERAN